MRQLDRYSFLGRFVRTLVTACLSAARSFQLARIQSQNIDAPPTLRQRATWHAAAVTRAAAPLRGKDAMGTKLRAERRVPAERATWAS